MNADLKHSPKRNGRMSGFSTLELLVVLAISAILAAIAVPNVQKISQALRIGGDLRDLNGAVAQAKMNAAADFTHARARANLGTSAIAPNTFQVEIWNKALNGGAGCWQTVGDLDPAGLPRCTIAGTSPVQALSQGVTFGTDNVGAPPPNTQAVFGQAGQCGNVPAGVGAPAGSIAGTACVEFNSRGLPVNATPGAAWGTPYGDGAFYVNNGSMVYALTVGATGYALNWSVADTSGNSSWKHR